jgi:hypothetical protein
MAEYHCCNWHYMDRNNDLIVIKLPFLSRSHLLFWLRHCFKDPIVATIPLCSLPCFCCDTIVALIPFYDQIIIMILLLPWSHLMIKLLSWSYCCHGPILLSNYYHDPIVSMVPFYDQIIIMILLLPWSHFIHDTLDTTIICLSWRHYQNHNPFPRQKMKE